MRFSTRTGRFEVALAENFDRVHARRKVPARRQRSDVEAAPAAVARARPQLPSPREMYAEVKREYSTILAELAK